MPVIVRDAPHASADSRTLDVPEAQLMKSYPDDLFRHHHRVLLMHVKDSQLEPVGHVNQFGQSSGALPSRTAAEGGELWKKKEEEKGRKGDGKRKKDPKGEEE